MVMSLVALPTVSSIEITVAILRLSLLGMGAFLANQHAFKQDVSLKQLASLPICAGRIETFFAAILFDYPSAIAVIDIAWKASGERHGGAMI